MSISLFAQVIIEERIEIGGITSKDNLKKGSSMVYSDSVVSGFIMPRSGVLQVYYSYINHFDRELPIYSTLNSYFFKGDSTSVDSLTNRFTSYIIDPRTYYNYCPPAGWEERDVWMYLSPDPYLYELGNINEGDSVQMIYHSDALGVETDIPISYADEVWVNGELVGWDVTFAYYDACILEYANELQLFVGVVKEYELMVSIEPDEIAPGDTADVILKKKLPDGTLLDFDSTQTFEVGMMEGCMSGKLIVGTTPDTGSYFYNIHQPIRFAAADSLVGDSTGSVIIQVGVVDSVEERINREKRLRGIMPDAVIKKTGRFERDTIPLICNYPGFWQTGLPKPDTLMIKKYTILLGETKYYQARYKTVDELIIEEAPVGANGVPYLDGGLAEDVWGNDPVTVIPCDSCAQRMSVYWEKKYPVQNQWVNYTITLGDETVNYEIVKMDSLQTGLIRLIGRYWTQDSTYLVTLKAKRENGDSGQIQIKVLKPSQLKSEGQSTSYSKARDVFDHPINVDSLCILLGGKYGIPPQLIKGQMLKEAATKNFGGNIGSGFAPSYRYEPYTTQFNSAIKNNINYNKFYIKDSTYSFSNVPNHNHVLYHDYFRSIKTVWDIIRDYSQLVNGSNSDSTYGNRLSSNFMSFSPYTKKSIGIQQKYDGFKNYYTKKYQSQLTSTVIADSTNERMIKYFKKEWKNVGAEKILAQTRAASSYGLLQMLYSTARGRDYPNDTIPENINLLKYLELFLKTQKKYLQEGLGINVESGNNWTDGFEYSLSTKIYVPKWNTIPTYAKGVYTNSKMFLPKKSLE